MSDFTVLVQGPLDETSLENLDYYKTIGPVVISCWNTDDFSKLSRFDLSSTTILAETPPQKNIIKYGKQYKTFHLQVFGIYYGLTQVKTRFVIRTRSDEFYKNLDPLLKKFEQDTGKVVCGNIFFHKWFTFCKKNYTFAPLNCWLKDQ